MKKAAGLALQAAKIVPVTAPVIENGTILIADGKIEAVGKTAEVPIPEGYEIIDYADAVIYPGLIDASSHLGVNKEPFNYYSENRDGADSGSMISPELKAADAINPADRALEAARRFGITCVYSAVGHGNLVDGQGIVMKLKKAETAGQLCLAGTEQMNMTLGSYVLSCAAQEKKPPHTRMGMMQMVRKALEDAKKLAAAPAQEQEKAGTAERLMAMLLRRERKARIYCETAQDMVLAVELAEEFGLDYILDGAQEAFLLPEFLKEHRPAVVLKGIPFGPMQTTVAGNYGLDLGTAARLSEWGCPLALTADDVTNTARLPMIAGIQCAYGLSEEEALRALTITPAKLLGIDHRTGSLEKGKDADLAVFAGDLLDTLSPCLAAYADGEQIYRRE